MKYILAFLVLSSSLVFSQNGQINHPNASQLNYNNTSGGWTTSPQWIPGPFVANLGPGPGDLVTMTQGMQGMYFESFASSGPPLVGSDATILLNGDTLHLNLNTLWHFGAYWSGHTPCNAVVCGSPNGPWGAAGISWPYSDSAQFNFATQSWVTDPTNPLGYRLTASIHVIK